MVNNIDENSQPTNSDEASSSNIRSPSPSLSSTYSDSSNSVKSNLKRKNLDNDDEEAVETKSKGIEGGNKHKIKTRSQTARELYSNKPCSSSKLPKCEATPGEDENAVQSFCNISNLASIRPDQATEDWLTTFREWNSKNKLMALEQILEICDHSHIKHVHNFIEPKLQRDYISELPRELVLLLLTYVRPRDLYKLAQVSHYWHQTANDTILWKNICRRHRVDLDNLNNNTSMILNEFKENNFRKLNGIGENQPLYCFIMLFRN